MTTNANLPSPAFGTLTGIRLVMTDCDGVLTDAGVFYSERGEELARFSRRDGMGIERLRLAGVETGIVSRENSKVTARRAERLGLAEVHLGVPDKLAVIRSVAARRGLELEQIAFIGDDVQDLEALGAVGFSACPADAEPVVREAVDYVASRPGGHGAFRECADLLLSVQRCAREAGPADGAPGPALRILPGPRRRWLKVGPRGIGDGEPAYVIAEIGINHNGSVDIAKKLIDGAVAAGCDCVKFQKRTPELCVPPEQQGVERDTPWGRMTYLDYRRRVELNFAQYAEIDRYCRDRGIAWAASCWDGPSVDFVASFDPPFFKVASATLTDHVLLRKIRATGKPLMLSTGMSTMGEIDAAVREVGADNLLIAHATSTYPCAPRELNLRMILTLQDRFDGVPIGYSGHETGLATTYAAVALGAAFVERHITLDRSMWGSDQAASVEIVGLMRLVRDLRDIEGALGDGIKRVYASELGALRRLRRVPADAAPRLDVAQA